MTAWDIDPTGVQATLTMVGEAGGRLEKAANSLVSDLASAASSAGTAVPGYHGPMIGPVVPGTPRNPVGPVASALSQWMTERQTKLAFMAKRTANSVEGTVKATNAYNQGNLEMAANAQREALKEPKIDMPGKKTGAGGGK
ncbi:DUF6507 family protein [Streptomyces sp. NPDC008313]|uniref:DUF6507 family protein n=1 Tax=Streptomyces sp. NPDC008313 TaxID=3364826 RepID=UPI0036E25439